MTAEIIPLNFLSQGRKRDDGAPKTVETIQDVTVCAMHCERCDYTEDGLTAPVGIKWFDCPKCETKAFRRSRPVAPAQGVERQQCPHCTGQIFMITRASLVCCDCGGTVIQHWGP